MKLPDSVLRARDEARARSIADTYETIFFATSNSPEGAHYLEIREGGFKVGFDCGFDACYAHLSEQAGEFDEKAAHMASLDVSINTHRRYDLAFIAGATFQFEQDRARIALAESKAETYLYRMQEYAESVTVFAAKIKALEEKLAAAEAKLKQVELEYSDYVNETEGSE